MNKKHEKNLKRHHGRTDLIGEHRWGDGGQIVFLILFLIIWIGDSFFLKYSTFLQDYIPVYFRTIIALLILSVAWVFARRGLRIIFGEVREKPELVRKGVFEVVRHPIYLGAMLLYLGLTLFTLSLVSFVLWIFIVIFYCLISRYEEKVLTKAFGEEYEKYKKEVPMMFPSLLRKNK